ncbi:MAG: twin-arginine translocase TatA/TatE family subunit [Bdellovibrionales bacterium]|nr:twin-arginine translocase TatA/TatE family subunit [Bdellovibrionales bacterium]
MFNLGLSELIVLGAIALIVIGPKQLPELARNLARLVNELKRATSDFRSSFTEVNELKEAAKEVKSIVHDTEHWVQQKTNETISATNTNLSDAHKKDTKQSSPENMHEGHAQTSKRENS